MGAHCIILLRFCRFDIFQSKNLGKFKKKKVMLLDCAKEFTLKV